MASFLDDTFSPIYRDIDDKKKTRLIGVELEVVRENRTDEWMEDETGDEKPLAAFGFDGGDIELVTQPFSENLLTEDSPLAEAFKVVNKHKCTTNEQSGTHINVGKLDSDSEYTYDNIIWIQTIYLEQMQKIFGRVTSWARTPFESLYANSHNLKTERMKDLKYIRALKGIFFDADTDIMKRFSARNNKRFMVTDKENRYEFRGGKSTIDVKECLAWAQFCKNIVDTAARMKELKRIKFKNFLKGDYIERYVEEVVQTTKSRKLSKEELEKPIQYTGKITITNRNKILK